MLAFEALTANRTFLPTNDDQHNQGRVRAAEQQTLHFPACNLPTGTVELGEAIRDHRGACIRAFVSCRFASALARITSTLAHITTTIATALSTRARVEDTITSQYQGRSWCDATERELNNDIASWRATRF